MKINIRDYTSPNAFHKSENDIAKELLELRYIDKDFFLLNHLFNKTLGKQNYTQEQMKCEYCHKEKTIKLSENYYLEIAPPSDANLVEKRSFDYEDWQIGTTKFDYCPRCGRKLGDE